MKYDFQTLSEFCKEHNIILCEDYSVVPLKRETFITGICENENCSNKFTKGFRALLKPNGYCQDCAKIGAKEKYKKTSLQKYGVEFTTQSKKVKDKIKQVCLEKYGVEHSSQHPDIAEKQSKNAYKSKIYTFPSGRIEKIQGYENFMLDELLENNISEDDIVFSRKYVPEIWFIDSKGVKNRYFVDCFVKSENKCIEVKSTWTLKKEDVFLKHQAAKDSGYISEIWVYDRKGNKLETHY
jgi:hypothetical protein